MKKLGLFSGFGYALCMGAFAAILIFFVAPAIIGEEKFQQIFDKKAEIDDFVKTVSHLFFPKVYHRTMQCGNNVIEALEPCDGTALAGQTCQSLGFSRGALKCDSGCKSFDTSNCTK